MNLQQLEYIIALDKVKNFSRAAEMCFITQATLSTMVKKLEEELDLVLFDRKYNPIITTDCGKEIVELAKKVVFYANEIKESSLTIKGKIQGTINVGIIPTIANNLLPIIISPLLNKYKNLKINLTEITTENILRKLKDGTIDIGLISTPWNYSDEFEEEILYYEKLLVYGNIQEERKYVLPEELKEQKIWLLEEGHCIREQIINLCSLNKKKGNDNFSFEASSFETLLNMVDNFNGLTLIPELYAQTLSVEKKKKILEFQSPYPVREVSLVYYRPFAKFRLVNTLTDEIRNLVSPFLKTTELRTSEQIIVKV